ncbi:MAG: IS66 family insertion sequence element accessory protein TnpB [Methylococcaceae bacterium]|nr:IS66 family insertion sequence element accessory protein TnpB [Methylococcaceae bacterium]
MATATEQQDHIQAWQTSGLTQAAYCRQHGLNPTTFSGWWRQVRARPVTGTPELLPIQVAAAGPALPDRLVLRLAAGHQLELPVAVAPGWVAELLRCLS